MRRTPVIAALIALVLSGALATAQRDPFADLQPTVILISFDGFRWDYTSKAPTPNLQRLMRRGVRARNMIPSFPSKTFPNHYTIATGLYPGHHGVIANNIFDPPTGRLFATTKSEELRDPMWWGGTPIWTLIERNGRSSAPLFWPGSEAPHDGRLPTYWQPYEQQRPGAARVDQILKWIDLPTAQRPRLLTLYFEDTDSTGHDRGPDSPEVRDPMWWGGTPIWTLIERNGRLSAPFFWPGSEAPHDGRLPTYWQPYEQQRPGAARVDQILKWIDLPTAQRPRLLTLYFEDTDSTGHDRGPDSPEVRDAIIRDDGYVGRLADGLTERGILDRVNIVVVSDHGMAAVDDDHVIVADDYLGPDDGVISNINPDLSVFPTNGKDDEVYRKLVNAHPHLRVYRRAETPARWHLRDVDNPRIPPIVAIADPGWQVLRRAAIENITSGKVRGGRGQHGWDPQLMSMRAIFIAAGPAFKPGVTVAPFENVSVYNVLAQILGVAPAPNDGDPSVARALLRPDPHTTALR